MNILLFLTIWCINTGLWKCIIKPVFNNHPSIQYTISESAFSKTLRLHAKEGTVFLMLTDSAYINHLLNSYINGKLSQYSNLVVACLDSSAYDTLQQYKISSVYIREADKNRTSSSNFSMYASREFNKKLVWKLIVINSALRLGYTVFFMDSDIILFKSPFDYFNQFSDYELVTQKDEAICSGFMYIKPSRNILLLFNDALILHEQINADDQVALYYSLKNSTVKWTLLPPELFPSGLIYFNRHQFYWDKKNDSYYMLHNNWVIGKWAKEYRLKEMQMYALNVNQEYTSPSMKYLTFECVNQHNLTAILKRLVKIANALHRSLVIPPLTCNEQNFSFCNLCYFEKTYCFDTILRKAKLPVKESVFFTSPQVPFNLKAIDRSNPIFDFSSHCKENAFLQSSFPAREFYHNHINCKPCDEDQDQCIIRYGKKLHSRVYKVYSLD